MVASRLAILSNPMAVSLSDVPLLDSSEFRQELGSRIQDEGRLSALFGFPQGPEHARLFAIVGDPRVGQLAVCSTMVGNRYECLSATIPQALCFEREISEQWGVLPEGHPQLLPVRYQAALRSRTDIGESASVGDRIRTNEQNRLAPGTATVEIGPLQSGVSESGTFRFQCTGETIQEVDVQFGYQHRGIERALIGGPNKRTVALIDSLSGDSTVGHATAYAHAIEALSGASVPMRACMIRGVALELERVIHHTSELGQLAREIGFVPVSGRCGRLSNDYQEVMAVLCGSRQGIGLTRVGGVAFDLDGSRIAEIRERITQGLQETEIALKPLWTTPSVQSRLESCGVLSSVACDLLGLVGPTARACGCEIDVRHDFPSGIYRFHQLAISTVQSGDVFARAFVRWLEIQRSIEFIQQQLGFLTRLKASPKSIPTGPLRPDALAVSLVEGWRGEICHVGITDSEGKLARYKICDPTFHNWSALPEATANQPFADFPLIHRSLSLSSSGHDL